MKSKLIKFSLVVFAIRHLSGCALYSDVGNEKHRVELESDAVVRIDNRKSSSYQAGDVVDLDGDSALIEQPGHVSLLILPASKAGASYKVNLKPYEDWSGELVATKTNSKISSILSEISRVQVSLSKGETKAALSSIKKLQSLHPGVTYLKFYEATCHYILSNVAEARAAVRVALKDFPEDEQGKALLNNLDANSKTQKAGN